ncbi:MAG: alpha/beta hydrolase [Acidimicrobiales bacterium]
MGLRRWWVRARIVLALALVAPVLTDASARPALATDAAVTFADAHGIEVVGVQQLDERQYDVSVLTPALGRPVHVRILVPTGYAAADPSTAPALPVLYLFHGTSGRASDWVDAGGVVETTADLPLIVVMPDAGFDGNGGGWFTDWVDQTTPLGPSKWETFHVDQLIPWVDANLRTIASRQGRAVAGLSQGGFGSMTYAARHPDTFVSVASFSGAPDIDWNPLIAAGATVVIEGTALGLNRTQPEAMFGSRATNEINWQGHDPATLAENLRGLDIWLYTATGFPGEHDTGQPNPAASGIEGLTYASTTGFAERARQLGVPHHLVDYRYGTHTWAYWADDLRQYLPHAMAVFDAPPPAPAQASYRSVEPTWSQWGWTVTAQRLSPQDWTTLAEAGPGGFALTGVGRATVTTPALYLPGASLRVTMGSGLSTSTTTVTADGAGRLHLSVPLGLDVPSVEVVGVPQQPGSTTTVRIAPL